MEVQTSIALINNSAARATPLKESGDSQGQPHSHPALQGLEGLTSQAKLKALEQQQIAKLGERYGLDSVIRWKPKRVGYCDIVAQPISFAKIRMTGFKSSRIGSSTCDTASVICNSRRCGFT